MKLSKHQLKLFKTLTEFSKKVLKTQFNMMRDTTLNGQNEKCLNCGIREIQKNRKIFMVMLSFYERQEKETTKRTIYYSI